MQHYQYTLCCISVGSEEIRDDVAAGYCQSCVKLSLPKILLSKLLNNNIPYSLDKNRVADK